MHWAAPALRASTHHNGRGGGLAAAAATRQLSRGTTKASTTTADGQTKPRPGSWSRYNKNHLSKDAIWRDSCSSLYSFFILNLLWRILCTTQERIGNCVRVCPTEPSYPSTSRCIVFIKGHQLQIRLQSFKVERIWCAEYRIKVASQIFLGGVGDVAGKVTDGWFCVCLYILQRFLLQLPQSKLWEKYRSRLCNAKLSTLRIQQMEHWTLYREAELAHSFKYCEFSHHSQPWKKGGCVLSLSLSLSTVCNRIEEL